MEEKKYSIINGDCIEELKKIPNESIDLIFADPPYWMRISGILKRVEGTSYNGCNDEWDQFSTLDEYTNFTNQWLTECYRVLKKNGSIWVIGSMQCIYTIGAEMLKIGYWFINDVIWHKTNPTPNFSGTRLNNSHETLIWATKNQKSKFTFHYKTAKELNHENLSDLEFTSGIRKQLGSVWKIGICIGNERLKKENGEKVHSTQKPEELLYKLIIISSNTGDTILDPFGGTMTTGAIAIRTGRKFIGIEKSKEYCNYGNNRLKKESVKIGDLEKAIFDIKPIKVTLSEMISAQYLICGEKLFLAKSNITPILLADGKIKLPNEEITNIHEGAAKILNLKTDRVNGFDYWYVMRNNQLISIDEIRKKYREVKNESTNNK